MRAPETVLGTILAGRQADLQIQEMAESALILKARMGRASSFILHYLRLPGCDLPHTLD